MTELTNAGDPRSEDFSKGPEVGERIPGFTLQDQQGNPLHYQPDGRRKALILFYRSAAW